MNQRSATIAPKKLLLDTKLKPKLKSRWSVRLGSLEWAKHTYERSPDDPLQLLGSARRGLQSGALARMGDVFVLVVGDHVTALSHADNKEITAATARAKAFDRPPAYQPPPVRTAPPVVVVVKRRRIPVPH
jgi:hypothetical protein